jgi:hypothetical protein
VLRCLLVGALAVGVVSSAQLAISPRVDPARADAAAGSAGLFVPAQGTVLDTRSGIGGVSGPVTASTWYPVQVGGLAGVPTSGVSSVQVSVTAFDPSLTGYLKLAANGAADVQTSALIYTGGGGSFSASSIVALAPDGKIKLLSQRSVSLLIAVQGYYTAGDGAPAPGGYVPVHPARLVDSRNGTGLPQAKLAVGSTTAIKVGGMATVPADASAVFLMLTGISSSTAGGTFTPYPTGRFKPANVALSYLPNTATILGAAVELGTDGQFNLAVGSTGSAIDVVVDVVGYYTATPGTGGAFVPAAARVYDSRISPSVEITGSATRKVPIGGVAGVPLPGTAISAYAINVQVLHPGPNIGFVAVGPGDQAAAFVSSVYLTPGDGLRSNLVIALPGPDGTIQVFNHSPDPIDIVLDVEGWYRTPSPAPPIVTSSSFIDGQFNAAADANATFTFAASPDARYAPVVAFRYALDQDAPATVAGPSATVLLPVTTDGPHNLTVSGLDSNGSESDVASFAFEIGDSTPATEETADNGVQTTVSTTVTATEPDGTSSTEVTSTAAATPQQLPSGGGGSIPSVSCRLGNHREILSTRSILDIRYQCASHVVNYGIRLGPPPIGATRISYVFESGFEWYRDGRPQSHTAYHDEPIWYIFHGTFNPVYNQSHVYGTDHFHYGCYVGNTFVLVQISIRVEFIAVP